MSIKQIDWQKWLLTILTVIIIPWGVWVTVTLYNTKEIVSVKSENIRQLQTDGDKVSNKIDKINDTMNQMKNEQIRQGTILENIQKQITKANEKNKSYAFKME
jgi:hypothetical protein